MIEENEANGFHNFDDDDDDDCRLLLRYRGLECQSVR